MDATFWYDMGQMIKINQITGGRFGNRILHYNSLVQISETLQTQPSCVTWEGHSFFSDLVSNHAGRTNAKALTWKDILDNDITKLSKGIDYTVGGYCLHNTFWKLTKLDPRRFLKINEQYKTQLPEDNTNVGIHIRGGDILGADGNCGREIHEFQYYKKSIDLIEKEFDNTKYYVCTDDLDFVSYKDTIRHLEDKHMNYTLGDKDNQFKDFSTLSECDVLIASSSTFSVCAGFLGKEKKIVHSMEWIVKNIPGKKYIKWGNYTDQYPESYWKAYDSFWVQLYNGGNKFYNAWRFF